MRATFLSIAILFIINQLSFGQHTGERFECSYIKSINRNAARVSVADPVQEKYDIKYVKFDLKLANDTTYVGGNVSTTARVVATSLSLYVFELDNALVVDTVFIDGTQAAVTSFGDVRTVALPHTLTMGTMFTARVVYHGYPSVAGTIFTGIGGLNTKISPTWGTRITFTQSEAYHAKEWWPCKQSLHDKIDSVDMWVTVPDTLKAGSNGVLTGITPVDATHNRYEWKSRHPIDYYLISVAVAPYIDYSYYMHFSGSSDSMLIQNYVYDNPATLPFFKNVIDSVGMYVDYFSKIYSRYPFWNEKYGHCMAPLNGGMENQTMTTIGNFQGWIVAHELGHQWFGDNVTCGTWADIFVNEGAASYTEDLYREHFHSRADMIADMVEKQANVRKYDTGSIFIPAADTIDEGRVFDSRLSYHKGACMLHMLRHVINNDSIFFHIYKSYQQEHREGNATIADFRNVVKSIVSPAVNEINIDTFFKQWAYGEGFPVYHAKWNQKGNEVYVQLDQTTKMPSSVACFSTPIEIRLRAGATDTLIRVTNDRNSQLYHFTWRKTMTGLNLDPNEWVLDSVAGITKDVTLSSMEVPVNKISIHPNPTATSWSISGLTTQSTLLLCDMSGKVLWEKQSSSISETIPADDLPKGMYVLKIFTTEGELLVRKLIKQ